MRGIDRKKITCRQLQRDKSLRVDKANFMLFRCIVRAIEWVFFFFTCSRLKEKEFSETEPVGKRTCPMYTHTDTRSHQALNQTNVNIN